VAPVIQERPIAKRPFVPQITWATISKPIAPGPLPPARHGHRHARCSRQRGRARVRTPRTSRPRVAADRGVAIARLRPRRAPGRRCRVICRRGGHLRACTSSRRSEGVVPRPSRQEPSRLTPYGGSVASSLGSAPSSRRATALRVRGVHRTSSLCRPGSRGRRLGPRGACCFLAGLVENRSSPPARASRGTSRERSRSAISSSPKPESDRSISGVA